MLLLALVMGAGFFVSTGCSMFGDGWGDGTIDAGEITVMTNILGQVVIPALIDQGVEIPGFVPADPAQDEVLPAVGEFAAVVAEGGYESGRNGQLYWKRQIDDVHKPDTLRFKITLPAVLAGTDAGGLTLTLSNSKASVTVGPYNTHAPAFTDDGKPQFEIRQFARGTGLPLPDWDLLDNGEPLQVVVKRGDVVVFRILMMQPGSAGAGFAVPASGVVGG